MFMSTKTLYSSLRSSPNPFRDLLRSSQLITDVTPFEADDPTEMFKKIAHSKGNLRASFPRGIDKKSKKLIESILEETPIKRLGCRKKGIEELWDHPWFDGFTADMVERKALNAPFVPQLSGPLDVINFEDYNDFAEDVGTFSYGGPTEPFRKWGGVIKN